MKNESKESLVGRKFKFVVQTSEEAVNAIREHLGEEAQVLSVNQVGGKGLSRFLSSPKLEVIAMIPKKEKPAMTKEDRSLIAGDAPKDVPLPEAKAPSSAETLYGKSIAAVPKAPSDKAKEPSAAPVTNKKSSGHLAQLLQTSGFNIHFISSLSQRPDFKDLESRPISEAMGLLLNVLRKDFAQRPRRETTDRVAFFGMPGVGKTSLLCKCLSKDVMLHSKEAQVVKLEGDAANSDEALSTFCDAFSVSFLRESITLEGLRPQGLLYLDTPGLSLSDINAWSSLNQKLNHLNATTRVLVLHAAFDEHVLEENFERARIAGATHVAFTYLDSITHSAKLISFIIKSGLTPFMISYGEGVTGDSTPDVFEYLIRKTFPAILV